MRCFAYVGDDSIGPVSPYATIDDIKADNQLQTLTAANIRALYQVPPLASGQTVPIVAIINVGHYTQIPDASGEPSNHTSAEDDLNIYRSYNDMPACTAANGCFAEYNQNGVPSTNWNDANGPTLDNTPPIDVGWTLETALDLDMVSATCPECRIMMVDAQSSMANDIVAATARATALGARYISLSLGGNDAQATQTTLDAFDAPGVAYFASTGDNGAEDDTSDGLDEIGWPAVFPSVVAVGGTYVEPNGSGGWSESAWGHTPDAGALDQDGWVGAGAGCSQVYSMAPEQAEAQGAVDACGTKRAVADIGGIADGPDGAVFVVHNGNLKLMSGTSVTAPVMASIAAIAQADDHVLEAIYDNPVTHPGTYVDITTGQNGACATLICNAAPGWDGPTGVGSPRGVAAFLVTRSATSTQTVAQSASDGGDLVKMAYQKKTKQKVTATYKKKVKGKLRSIRRTVTVAISRTSSVKVGVYPASASAAASGSATCVRPGIAAALECAQDQADSNSVQAATATAQQAAITQATAAANQARAAAQAKALAAAKKAVSKVKKPTKSDVAAAKKAAAAAAKAAWIKKYGKKK